MRLPNDKFNKSVNQVLSVLDAVKLLLRIEV